MSLTVEDLLQPLGEIERDLFDSDDLNDPYAETNNRVSAYLDQAIEKTEDLDDDVQEDAQRNYVYWRALSSFVRYVRSLPADQTENQSKRTYTEKQLVALENEALGYKAAFEAYIADEAGDIVATKPTTTSVKTEVVW